MEKTMKRKMLCFLLTLVQIMSFATSRHFSPLAATAASVSSHQQAAHQHPQSHQYQLAFGSNQGGERMEGVRRFRSLRALGSRPPNCDHKCGGCKPCFAIQAPSTIDLVGVQFANYKPEGWKCKCGTSFFNP